MAVQSEGEWLDHAEAYCETSQQPMTGHQADVGVWVERG